MDNSFEFGVVILPNSGAAQFVYNYAKEDGTIATLSLSEDFVKKAIREKIKKEFNI